MAWRTRAQEQPYTTYSIPEKTASTTSADHVLCVPRAREFFSPLRWELRFMLGQRFFVCVRGPAFNGRERLRDTHIEFPEI